MVSRDDSCVFRIRVNPIEKESFGMAFCRVVYVDNAYCCQFFCEPFRIDSAVSSICSLRRIGLTLARFASENSVGGVVAYNKQQDGTEVSSNDPASPDLLGRPLISASNLIARSPIAL